MFGHEMTSSAMGASRREGRGGIVIVTLTVMGPQGTW
jgi:hypothetical protein